MYSCLIKLDKTLLKSKIIYSERTLFNVLLIELLVLTYDYEVDIQTRQWDLENHVLLF